MYPRFESASIGYCHCCIVFRLYKEDNWTILPVVRNMNTARVVHKARQGYSQVGILQKRFALCRTGLFGQKNAHSHRAAFMPVKSLQRGSYAVLCRQLDYLISSLHQCSLQRDTTLCAKACFISILKVAILYIQAHPHERLSILPCFSSTFQGPKHRGMCSAISTVVKYSHFVNTQCI